MIEKISFLWSWLQRATAYGSRSTILYPLNTLLVITLGSAAIAFYYKWPKWIGYILIIIFVSELLLYLFSFIYFSLRNPDLLRSEKFVLGKTIIEKGIIGDNVHGLFSEQDLIGTKETSVSSRLGPKKS